MNDFYQVCAQLLRQESVVTATIVSKRGSAPRTAGTKMLVREDGSFHGTIGGGKLEAEALTLAKEAFQRRQSIVREFEFLGEDAASTDMICGGKVTVLVEYLPHGDTETTSVYSGAVQGLRQGRPFLLVTRLTDEPTDAVKTLLFADESSAGRPLPASVRDELSKEFAKECYGDFARILTMGDGRFFVESVHAAETVYILGAGHVSQQLAKLAKVVGFRTVVVDDRAEFANRERFADADEIVVADTFDGCLGGMNVTSGSYIVIVTRGHLCDEVALRQALETPARYIGMIGSRRKRDLIYQSLQNHGVSHEDLAKVHSPIGLAIGAETPEEIAVSIVSEMIAERRGC